MFRLLRLRASHPVIVGSSLRCREALRSPSRCRLGHPLLATVNQSDAEIPPCSPRFKYTKSYQHGHDHGETAPALVAKTFGQAIDDTTEKYPDEEFVIFFESGVRKTFSKFRKQVDRFAAGLVSLGVGRGDRVGIWGPNSLEWTLTMFAASRIGAISVNLNPAYQTGEIEYALKKVRVKAVVASRPFRIMKYYDMLSEICPELETASPGRLQSKRLPSLETVIMMGEDEHPGSFKFDDVLDMGRSEHYDVIDHCKKTVQFDDVMNIQFTSGTTGHPKATCLTHFNILNDMACYHHVARTGGPGKVTCLPVPLYHASGMSFLSYAMLHGHKVVFPSAGFDPKMCLQALQDERCTLFGGVPTMLIDLLNHPEFSTFDVSTIESIILGGSDVPGDLRRKVEKRFGAKANCLYGMTEASAIVTVIPPSDPDEARHTTVGRALPWTEVKIVDPSTSEIVNVNSRGELCVRGPIVMTEYWDDVEKTKETIDPARWLHTGDLATMDEDGYVSIVGRIKDVVIRGGVNIFPAQIENLLHTHPKVQDVQVVGVPDERMIEELCACVRLNPDVECAESEIRDFCKGKISHFMVPRYVQFVDSFPLTATGKVQKFKLAADMADRLNLK